MLIKPSDLLILKLATHTEWPSDIHTVGHGQHLAASVRSAQFPGYALLKGSTLSSLAILPLLLLRARMILVGTIGWQIAARRVASNVEVLNGCVQKAQVSALPDPKSVAEPL